MANLRKVSMMRNKRVIFAGIILALLTGCSSSSSRSGVAAVVGNQEISQNTIASQLNEVKSQIQGGQPGGQLVDGAVLGQQIVNRLVLTELINQAVSDLNVSVPQSKVTKFQEGVYSQYGQKQVEQQLLTTQAIPASEVQDFFRLLLSEEAVSEKLSPTGNTDQRNAAFSKYMANLAKQSNIEVSPRYGAWDSTQFKVTGADNELSSLMSAE